VVIGSEGFQFMLFKDHQLYHFLLAVKTGFSGQRPEKCQGGTGAGAIREGCTPKAQ